MPRSLNISYNPGSNLPNEIVHPEGVIQNQYSLSGQKIGKKVLSPRGDFIYKEHYYGDLVVKDDLPTRILHGDGVVNLSGSEVEFTYHLKDHLGNVRVVFAPDDSNNPDVLQVNDYYPFGMVYTTNAGANKYLYNSKEEQEMPGKFLDYGWRMYDAQLGRFQSVDPHAANYHGWTPYNYVGNNPILLIDPDGRDWYDINGSIIWLDQTGDLTIDDQTYQSLGANVLVSYHMRDEDGNEEINTAWHALYLETDTNGPTEIIEGNTVPADIETMNTIAEGLYPAHFQGRASRQREDGTNPDQALIINNGQNVPNTSGGTMNGVFFHHGNVGQERLTTSTPGVYVSRGCPTGPSGPNTLDRFNTFMQHAQDFNGNYYLRSNRIQR